MSYALLQVHRLLLETDEQSHIQFPTQRGQELSVQGTKIRKLGRKINVSVALYI